MNRVLLVQSDPDLAFILTRCLVNEGLDVQSVSSGDDGRAHVELAETDLILLDGDIPDEDALETCAALRQSGFTGGIVVMSSRNREIDRVTGLDSGADDYLGKPCGLAELRASVQAVLRRVERAADRLHELEDLAVRTDHASATYRGTDVPLTELEHLLLSILIERGSRVVTHKGLAQRAWPGASEVSQPAMSVAISRLRARLADAGVPHQIETLRAVGYRLMPPSAL